MGLDKGSVYNNSGFAVLNCCGRLQGVVEGGKEKEREETSFSSMEAVCMYNYRLSE